MPYPRSRTVQEMASFVAHPLQTQLAHTAVTASERGFHTTSATPLLDASAMAFMEGAQRVLHCRFVRVHEVLATIPTEFQGFAYEGAGMSACLMDRLNAGRGWRVPLLLAGDGYRFRHLIHVGIGWGMARLRLRTPRPGWGLDPLLRWLALDGLGFHNLFFANEGTRIRLLSTTVDDDYHRAVMQGYGRSLWFIGGADTTYLDALTRRLPYANRAAIWSGVGLAAAYAGAPNFECASLYGSDKNMYGAISQGITFGRAARAAQEVKAPPSQFDRHSLSPDECLTRCARTARDLTIRQAPIEAYRAWQIRLETPILSTVTPT